MNKPTREEAEAAIRVLQYLAVKLAQFNNERSLWEAFLWRYPDKECLSIASKIQSVMHVFRAKRVE